jgi:hypothetical protein
VGADEFMNKRHTFANFLIVVTLSVFFLTTACTHTRLQIKAIDAPPPSSKLRIFVLPVTTGQPSRGWKNTHEEFALKIYERTSKFLMKKDIYQVVPFESMTQALGQQKLPEWKWEQDNWILVKKVGKALHADYAMIQERGFDKELYAKMVLINLETGKVFDAFMFASRGIPGDFKHTMKMAYKKIFKKAKGDLLATAVRKERVLLPQAKAEPPVTESTPQAGTDAALTAQPVPDHTIYEKAGVTSAVAQRAEMSPTQSDTPDSPEENRLVVYDFASNDQFRVIGLILTEALREELLAYGKYTLIDRENVTQALEEMALQQTGLVDESQALKAGRWLAANEAVFGKLNALGTILILQAKRTDIETMSIIAVGSLKTKMGQEEELLDGMKRLARKLVLSQDAP